MRETKSNEKEIREAVREHFQNKFPLATIRDEFTQNHLTVRNDLFVVSENVSISIEIKSCSDTFSRLEKQVRGYKAFSNAIIVAIDHKHVKAYYKKFLSAELFQGVGLISYHQGELTILSEPEVQEFPMMYDMMWSSELLLFFSGLKYRSKMGKSAKDSRYYIDKLFTYQEIYNISKYIFINRIKKNDLILNLTDDLCNLILTKQEVFTNLIKGTKNV